MTQMTVGACPEQIASQERCRSIAEEPTQAPQSLAVQYVRTVYQLPPLCIRGSGDGFLQRERVPHGVSCSPCLLAEHALRVLRNLLALGGKPRGLWKGRPLAQHRGGGAQEPCGLVWLAARQRDFRHPLEARSNPWTHRDS
jgi:hypothetical protein